MANTAAKGRSLCLRKTTLMTNVIHDSTRSGQPGRKDKGDAEVGASVMWTYHWTRLAVPSSGARFRQTFCVKCVNYKERTRLVI